MAVDNRRIAKNTFFLYIRMMFVLGVSLATAGITLRVLGEVDYGLNAVLGGIVAMFSFLNGALSGACSRYLTFELGRKDYDRLKEVFNAALVVHLGLAVAIVVLSETIGLWFFYNKMVIPPERMNAAFWVLQLSILMVPISLTQVPYGAVIIAHENMGIYAYTSIADVVARLGILYLLYVSPYDKLITLSALSCAWSLMMIIFYRIYCIRRYKETSISFCRDWGLYKGMFAYAGSDLIGNVSVLAQGQGLNLLLNTFFGPVVNAARGIAYGVQGVIAQFSNNFMTAARPQIIKSYAEGDIGGMWRLVERSSWFSCYLLLLLALPVYLEADFLLKLWLGKYPEHTLSFLLLIIIHCMIQSVKTPRSTVFHATGHLLLSNVIIGTILCAAFPFAYIALRLGGSPESVFWAANISIAITEFVSPFILVRFVKMNIMRYMLNVHGRCLLTVSVACIIPCVFYDKVFDPGFLRLLWTCVISSISICCTVFLLGMDRASRNWLIQFIRGRLNMIALFVKR